MGNGGSSFIAGLREMGWLAPLLSCSDDTQRLSVEEAQSLPVCAVTLNVAHTCNLRCRYCFTDDGAYGGQVGLMTEEVALRTIDWVIEASGSVSQLRVNFFGGEPLLAFPLIQQVLAYCHQQEQLCGKRFQYSLATNGVLLDQHKLKFLREYDVFVNISLDGLQKVHDAARVFPDGSGSFTHIMKNLPAYLEAYNTTAFVRMTFTHQNLDLLAAYHFFREMGFRWILLAPVSTSSPAYQLTVEDWGRAREEFTAIIADYQQRIAQGCYFALQPLYNYLQKLSRLPSYMDCYGCRNGINAVVVALNGDIYPCYRLIGQSDYRLGNVFDPGHTFDKGPLIKQANVERRKLCRQCWARWLCGGDCYADAIITHGDIDRPIQAFCHWQRWLISQAVYLFNQLSFVQRRILLQPHLWNYLR